MLRRLICLSSFIVLIATLSPLTAWACSGYFSFSAEDLPEMDLIVRATVIDADDRGYSAVVRVDEYYKGEGPALLTVMRYTVGLETGNAVRGYDTGCLYDGQGHRWRPGSEGYFGLLQHANHIYSDSYYGSAHFIAKDGQVAYDEVTHPGLWSPPTIVSEDDFVAKLLEAGGREEPVAPTTDVAARFPLKRFLMITTENGARYQVNPDRSVTPVKAETARFISPDNAHVAMRIDENTLGFTYIWTSGPSPEEIEQMIKLPGHDLRFSNDSHMVAVWDDSQLAVYMFRRGGAGAYLDWGFGMQMDKIASSPLELTEGASAIVQWSADNSTIAWQDDSGIWRWDLYNDGERSRVNPSSNAESAKLLDLSESGRYVRYLTDTGWELYDSETGEVFANALASAGDRHLIFVNSADAPINYWGDRGNCRPPLRKNCAVHMGMTNIETITVFPYQMELLGLIGCTGEQCKVWGRSWHPASPNQYRGKIGGRYLDKNMTNLRQVAFDPAYDQPAILRGDYQIEFSFYNSDYFDKPDYLPYLDYLNLEGVVDSPIVSIEWGRPIFYDTFMLTATEYLPRTVSTIDAAPAHEWPKALG